MKLIVTRVTFVNEFSNLKPELKKNSFNIPEMVYKGAEFVHFKLVAFPENKTKLLFCHN